MRDFSLQIYKELLESLKSEGYDFQTYAQFTVDPSDHVIILRHDVDDRNLQSLRFARMQKEMGISGTYYFRMIPQSFDEGVVRDIASMGHEIGYHYEDMDFASGDPVKAIKSFENNLNKLRKVTEIKTICMHGSPLGRYDNRELWRHYDYHIFDILAEPYFDLDFTKVLYLTDTGRRWNGSNVSIRDRAPEMDMFGKIDSTGNMSDISRTRSLSNDFSFRSTQEIINTCRNGKLPSQIMFNFHPQRWTDDPLWWTRELITQNVKNVVKWGIKKFR